MVSMAEEDRLGQRDWGGDTASLGGYGSAGLYSRRRQMERTTGGSYMNLSDAPRGGVSGGYVSMPTVGPRPQETTPLVSGHTGPSGPTAMAQGVRGSYAASPPDVPKWGQTSTVLGRGAGGALIAGAKSASTGRLYRNPLSDEERGSGSKYVTRQSRDLLRQYKVDKAAESQRVADDRALDEGYLVPSGTAASEARRAANESLRQGAAKIGRIRSRSVDPTAMGSGASIEDTSLATGLPSTSAIGALSAGSPVMPGRRDTSQDVTSVNAADFADPAPTREGPIVVGTQRALPPAGGSTRATTRLSSADEPQARLVRQTTEGVPDFPGMRPSADAEQKAMKARSSSYEYPNYNPRLGAKLRRTATRGERTATRDPNQMGLFDPNA